MQYYDVDVVVGLASDLLRLGVWDDYDFQQYADSVYQDGFRGGVQCYAGGFEDAAELASLVESGELVLD